MVWLINVHMQGQWQLKQRRRKGVLCPNYIYLKLILIRKLVCLELPMLAENSLEKGCNDKIQEQITVQDIKLRQLVQTNSLTTRKHRAPQDRQTFKHSILSLQSPINLVNSNVSLNNQQRWRKGTQQTYYSSSNSKKRQAKINSMAYEQRSNSVSKYKSTQKRKVKISLSLLNKCCQSMMNSDHGSKTQLNSSCYKSALTVEIEKEMINIEPNKENSQLKADACHLESKESGVRIQQPHFIQNHPVQSYLKYNGKYLSKIIIERTFKIQTQPIKS